MPDHDRTQTADNGWGEWKLLVLERLDRHNRAMEKHFDDDVRQFKEVADGLAKINNRLAYAAGAVGVLVILVNVIVEVWKRM